MEDQRNITTPVLKTGSEADVKQGIMRWAGQMIAALVIAWVILFLAPEGWIGAPGGSISA